jgi:hypothetical protein
VWDESRAFLRAEIALLLPVAAATIGAAMLLLLLVVPDPVAGRLPGGPWLLWLVPIYALLLLGLLAIAVLALRPGISVRESLILAARRLPASAMIGSLPVGLIGMLEIARSGAPGPLTAFANFVMLAVLMWLSIRLLPIWPLVADRAVTPLAAVRATFAMTRGHAGRLLGLVVIAGIAAALIGAAILFTGGAALMMIGRAAGGEALGSLLVAILFAAVAGAAAMVWAVFVAFLYRQLSETASG